MTTTAVRERPILFGGEMVRAIFDGRKTQTRRVIVPQPSHVEMNTVYLDGDGLYGRAARDRIIHCPFGEPGDRLWVRETWGLPPSYDPEVHGELKTKPRIGPVCYGADYGGRPAWKGARWRPSIHMPRWASRLTLEITDVRVQRVQEISNVEAELEGVTHYNCGHPDCYDKQGNAGKHYGPRGAFYELWNSLNKKAGYGWDLNPWVWCLTFRRIDA